MGEDKKSNRWVSAWSTSPIDASLVRGRRPRPARRRRDGRVRAHSRAAHGRRHARAPDALERVRRAAAARGRLHRCHRRGRCARHRPGHAAHRDLRAASAASASPPDELHLRMPPRCRIAAGQTLTVTVFYRGINAMRTIGLIGGCSHAELGNCTRPPPCCIWPCRCSTRQRPARTRSSPRSRRSTCWQRRDARVRHLRRLNRGKRAAASAGGAPARGRDRQRERDTGRHQGRPAGGRRRRPRGEAPRRRGREALQARRGSRRRARTWCSSSSAPMISSTRIAAASRGC